VKRKPPLDVAALWSIRRIGPPTLSPDGGTACSAVTRFDMEKNDSSTSLWLFPTGLGPPRSGASRARMLTAGDKDGDPKWSPDGKWIAFTLQTGEFDICVMPADGSAPPTMLVSGEDPSWSPNSRTLIFTHRSGGRYALSVLDVFTKQYKDIARISGNDSQPAWAR
jgi:Tol biopolymer transport system component